MNDPVRSLWTIQQLSARVEQALQGDYAGAPNGRVRDVPDLRTIRYYTTLGLLDRPAEMRGRTALYSLRHLLQLVAIKKLQASGLSLAEIQVRLAGATDAMLGQMAGGTAVSHADERVSTSRASRTDQSRPFWKSRPVPVRERPPRQAGPEDALETLDDDRASVVLGQEMAPLQAIALADGVVILLPLGRPLDHAELRAICKTAAPLIKHLRKLQSTPSPPKGEGHDSTASPVD